ncbi:hypothetical protein HY498_05200 [Candidatus Woesearchaeota archaeon]|nr:hypothetical protein [Candidatus Woesearchaeota archaeon]
MNKKIICLVLAIVLLIGMMPIVFADAHEDDVRPMKAKAKEIRKEVRETKEKVKAIKEDVKEVRKSVREDVEALKAKRADIKSNVKDFKSQCKDVETEECKTKFSAVKTDVKDHFLNVLGTTEKYLNQLKERLSSSEIDVSEAIAKVDEKLAALTSLKGKVNGISDSTTKEELRSIQKEIGDFVKDTKKGMAKAVKARATHAKLGVVIKRAESLEARLDRMLENAKENGKDTSKLEPLVSEFKTHVDNAKATYDEIKAKFSTVDNLSELIKKANDSLKAAHETLTKIHQELKSIKAESTEATTGGE